MWWGKKLYHFDKAKRQDKPVHDKCMECSHIYPKDNVNTNILNGNIILMRGHSSMTIHECLKSM